MLLIIGVLVAIVLIIVTRKSEIISHDPLEGAHQPPTGEAADARTVLKMFKEGKQADAIALFDKLKREVEEAADQDSEEESAVEGVPPDVGDAILDLVDEGKLLEAIKLYREATGCDLLTAKQAIDRLQSGQ